MPEVNQERLKSMLGAMADEIEPVSHWERIRAELRPALLSVDDDGHLDAAYVDDSTGPVRRRRRTMSILVAAAVLLAVIAVAVAVDRSSDRGSKPAEPAVGDATMPHYVPGWLPDGFTLNSATHGAPTTEDVEGWTVMLERDDGTARVTITSQRDLGAGDLTGGTSDAQVVQRIGLCAGREVFTVQGSSACFLRSAADLPTLMIDFGDRLLTLGAVGTIDDDLLIALANGVDWSSPTGLDFTVGVAGFTERFSGSASSMRLTDMWLAQYQAPGSGSFDAEKPWMAVTNLTISATQRSPLARWGDLPPIGEAIDINGTKARILILLPQQDGAPENYSVNWEMPGGISVGVSGQNLSRDDVVRVARSLRQVSLDEWVRATGSVPVEQGSSSTVAEPGTTQTTAAALRQIPLVLPDSGASQSPQDAARDHVVPAVAALPMSKRIKQFAPAEAAYDQGKQFVTDEGIWISSQLADDATPEGTCTLGDESGRYGVDFVCASEYGELLLLDPTGTTIVRAFPFPGQVPYQFLLTPEAVYCAHAGDGGLPNSMLCRVDRTTLEAAVRVFHCDLTDCGKREDELVLPGWTIDGAATIHGRLTLDGGRLTSSDSYGSSSFDATTLVLVESTTR